MDRIALFGLIFLRNKIHVGKKFTNYSVIKNIIKQMAFENVRKPV